MPGMSRARRGKWFLFVVLGGLPVFMPGGQLRADDAPQHVIGAKKGKVYHIYHEECASARRIRSDHRVVFESVAAAKRAGRRLCRRCEQLQASHADSAPSSSAGRGDRTSDRPQPRSSSGEQSDSPESPTPPPATATPIFARVEAVSSGGTIELDIGEKVCLAGVVCPQEGQPFAEEAVRFIIEQTRGRQVRLTLPTTLESQGSRDVFGRLRAYLVPGEDGRDLGGELIFQGYAWVCRDRACDRQDEYTRREEEAWRAQRGVWKPLDGSAGRREVVTGRHARHCFLPTSPYVARLSGPFKLTLNEAKLRRLPPYPEHDATMAAGAGSPAARTGGEPKEITKHEASETDDTARRSTPL